MKNLIIGAFLLALPAAALAKIPQCLKAVTNQVDVCRETIADDFRSVEKQVNKGKLASEEMRYVEINSFPTVIDGKRAILTLAKNNKGAIQVQYFFANIGYGLFWRKVCDLSPIKSDFIPEQLEFAYLSKVFSCNETEK